MTPDIALACWERAANEEIGIAIGVEKPKDLREAQRALYEAREGIEKYKSIRLCLPNGGKEVWLVKQTVEVIA